MHCRFIPSFTSLCFSLATLWLVGCAAHRTTLPQRQQGESVVLVGEEPAALAFRPLTKEPLVVRSAYQPGSGAVEYIAGKDYSVDFAAGTLRPPGISSFSPLTTSGPCGATPAKLSELCGCLI